MPARDGISVADAGLLLGGVLFVIDILLFIWLLRDRRARADETPSNEVRHFAGQDARRFAVCLILAVLSVALVWGSRVPAFVAGRPNPFFVQLWSAVIGLIAVLMVLAFFDWVATRFYARRRRLELLEEGLNSIARVRSAHDALHKPSTNGHRENRSID
ncbi:MAG: hypothetical protein SFX72_04955 [Isosphaeraceae bacterium]|nr:hypothetical protein [Isosphaeraceae bacterium]